MTKLEVAAWGLVLAGLGAEVGLVISRPWDHHVALSLSGSQVSTLSPSEPVTPSAGGKCPDVVVHRVEQPRTIPRSAWVHASDGVNVRAAPSSSATRLTTLATGTQLSLLAEQTNADGTTWDRIRLGDGRDGSGERTLHDQLPDRPGLDRLAADLVAGWLPVPVGDSREGPGALQGRSARAAVRREWRQGPGTDGNHGAGRPAKPVIVDSAPHRAGPGRRPLSQRPGGVVPRAVLRGGQAAGRPPVHLLTPGVSLSKV